MTTLLMQAGSTIASFLNRITPSTQTLRETSPLIHAEAPPPAAGQKSGANRTLIIVIAAAVLLCLGSVCLLVVLTLMGPAIGNVFSGILLTLETPVTP